MRIQMRMMTKLRDWKTGYTVEFHVLYFLLDETAEEGSGFII